MNTEIESKKLSEQIKGLLESRRFNEAIPLLREVLKGDQYNFYALNGLGAALLGIAPREGGGLDFLLEALYCFNKAGEFGLNKQITYNRGVCHERLSQEYPSGPKKEEHLREAMLCYRALAFKQIS